MRHKFSKFWRDEELTLLKDNSMNTYQLWTSLGRPRSGEVFGHLQQAKYEYKLAIRPKEKQNKEHFSDELNDALINKYMNSFWKCWKSTFSRKKVFKVVDGVCDPSVIAGKFANMFKTVCSPNSAERHSSLKSQFERNSATYDCGISNRFSVNVELVDRCISKSKRGKAAGLDGLTSEHLLYTHPVVAQHTYLYSSPTLNAALYIKACRHCVDNVSRHGASAIFTCSQ